VADAELNGRRNVGMGRKCDGLTIMVCVICVIC
jgi:hypothetical protein